MVTGPPGPPSLGPMPPLQRRVPVLLAFLLAFAAPALRAQVTEPTQTIAPGAVLLRVDALSLGLDPDTTAPNQYRAIAVGTTLVSAGITDSLDLEFGAQLFLQDTYASASGQDETHSGVGDITLRPKWTFWRDPASGQAAALIPYVMLPTHSSAVGNGAVEGGVIVPWSIDLAEGARAEAMAEWDEFRNVANTRYDTRWYGSADIKWELGHTVAAYGETTISDSTAGSKTFAGTVGGGATLNATKDFQWDLEVSRVIGSGRSAWAEVLRFRWKLL